MTDDTRKTRDDARNTRVVVALLLTMTAGALLLLWLEPQPPRRTGIPALMAASGTTVETVTIEYGPQREVSTAGVGCLILPSGQWDWTPDGPHLRLMVVGSGAEVLPDAQKKALLTVLSSLRLRQGDRPLRVRLQPASDVRVTPALPREARDLCDLLQRKGWVR